MKKLLSACLTAFFLLTLLPVDMPEAEANQKVFRKVTPADRAEAQ